ncbi:putative transposase [Neisseria sp. HSC-16F19]|nr:Mu transposase C-terminal domain-containing protein [Neisseria sp. HSC-16F19]MCP2041441.1 putative transposase [Neisseria sp. HSC-16F19]
MSDYLNAKELAALGVPELPKAVKNIIDKARRENWPCRKRQGRGGGVEYAVKGLPADIQAAIAEQRAAVLLAQAAPVPLPGSRAKAVAKPRLRQPGPAIDDYALGLTDKQRDCAHARMALVCEVLKMHQVAGLGVKAAAVYVVQQIECGTLPEALLRYVPVANARPNGQRGLSVRSLMGWVADYRRAKTPNERLAALAPKPTKTEVPVMRIEWLADFMGFHCRPSAPKLAHSYAQFAQWWSATRPEADLPTLDQVRRVWRKMPVIMQERGRRTGAAYKGLLPFVRRNWDALRPNDVWIGDGHSFKAKVQHPIHGQPFKPEVTVIIDGCTRMVVGFSFSLAESCVAVADALRIGIKHNGVPLMYYSDNGAGQTGKTIDHEITGLAARLGIHHETGLPGNPQGRGIIERWWKDNLIKLARDYETFTGAGMDSSTQNLIYRKLESAFKAADKGKELTAEQRRYRAKLPGWAQFQADVMRCIADYNRRPHGELPKKADGTRFSPLEYRDYRMAQENLIADYLAPQEMETLFRPQEVRKVFRGEVELFTNRYFAVDLAEHHGESVRVAYDYDDASAVYVYDMAGAFVCKAALDGNKRDAFPLTVRDRLAAQRMAGRVKRAQNTIRLAEAEARPAIEQQPDFGLLVGNGAAEAVPVAREKPLFLFESDREAWEREHGG